MKQPYIKTSCGVVALVLVILAAVVILREKPQEITPSDTNATVTSVQQTPPESKGVKVPEGWYSNQTYGIDHEMTVLSRTKELPKTLDVEHIEISKVETSLSPEIFAPHEGVVVDDPEGKNWSWGIYKGHKTFSLTTPGVEVGQWFVYVFGGHTVYEFSLSPNDQSNLNLAKDREDLWKVITYYVQNPLFEKLSRTETQQNCKSVNLAEDQKSQMQTEPETGYVVVNFMQDNKRKYLFFNYSDDLSQCTPSVKVFLENVKNSSRKLPQ